MKLKELNIRNAKSKQKCYKLFDGNGLFLEVMPNGSRYWRFKYYFAGKEKRIALGVYPEVSLAEAREKTIAARKLVRENKDPAHIKRQQKLTLAENSLNTFEKAARDWHKHNLAKWSKGHAQNIIHRLEKEIFPLIGDLPLSDITPRLLHKHIQAIQDRGANELARRMQQYANQIFCYALATERAERNPAAEIKSLMKPFKRGHYRALDYKDLPAYLVALDRNEARLMRQTLLALRFMVLTFVRTSELIFARWREIDFQGRQWVIPAERMKMRREHIVPLSDQAISILEKLKVMNPFNSKLGEENDWVFPQAKDPKLPMSNATMLGGVRRLGFKDRATVHGFRATAMTALKERLGYQHDIIDRQLSHAPADKLGRAYDRAEFLDQRKKMMQDWADHLDALVGVCVMTEFRKAG